MKGGFPMSFAFANMTEKLIPISDFSQEKLAKSLMMSHRITANTLF